MAEIDIVIPVFNEADNIMGVLRSLQTHVKTPFQVLICYDYDEDSTLTVVRSITDYPVPIHCLKNQGVGVHGAILTGLDFSKSAAVLVYPADDDLNTRIIDSMYRKLTIGSEIVAASRFMKGGSMKGCPFWKSVFVRVASYTLYRFALIPIRDASNGLRMFSRRLIDNFAIESTRGFTYSIELLVKCHRYGWKITEIPATWIEREKGESKFNIVKWFPYYLKWYFYGFQTTFLRKKPESVMLKPNSHLIE